MHGTNVHSWTTDNILQNANYNRHQYNYSVSERLNYRRISQITPIRLQKSYRMKTTVCKVHQKTVSFFNRTIKSTSHRIFNKRYEAQSSAFPTSLTGIHQLRRQYATVTTAQNELRRFFNSPYTVQKYLQPNNCAVMWKSFLSI